MGVSMLFYVMFFFAAESLDYQIFVGGGSNLMQLYGDFLKRVKIHAVFWLLTNLLTPVLVYYYYYYGR